MSFGSVVRYWLYSIFGQSLCANEAVVTLCVCCVHMCVCLCAFYLCGVYIIKNLVVFEPFSNILRIVFTNAHSPYVLHMYICIQNM